MKKERTADICRSEGVDADRVVFVCFSFFYIESIFGFGTGFYISLLLVKMIKRPELLSPWITILLAAAGIALGAVYMMYLKKKVTNRRPYLSLKQGMIIVWVVGLLCILLTQISHWTYWLCIFLSGMSVGYFFIYIPKFIEIKNYLTDLMKDYETEK